MQRQKISWLEYTKIILKKVSFDPNIFRKELIKALSRLSRTEILRLENWVINNFGLPLSTLAVSVIRDYDRGVPLRY
jgi:hypothetical protein